MPFCGSMDVAFVVDNTGSMNGAIDSVKAELSALVDQIQAASGGDYRLALLTPDTERVNVRVPFAPANGAAFQAATMALPGGAFGVGTPESTDECLRTAILGLPASARGGGEQTGDAAPFRPGALRIIVLITDAVPGGFDDAFTPGIDTPGTREYIANQIAEAAADANIRISAVAVGSAGGALGDFLRVTENYAVVSAGLFTEVPSTGEGTSEAVLDIIGACGGAPVTNFVPQGQSRVFPVDDVDLPTLSDASLWEVWRNGDLLDSGSRFDRFGADGWGVEPSPDFSRVTITVPRYAAIGEGYDARIRRGGDFPTVTFIVTPADDPPASEDTSMPHFLFSTGELIVSLPLPSPALERRTIGAPGASAQPLANLLDSSLQTLADLTQTDADNYQYLIADLGSSQKVGRVIAGNVALAGGGTLLAYVSAAKITTGNFAGATQLVAGNGALGSDREYIPAADAASVTGRYVYLVPSGGTGVSVGDLDLRSEEWRIGTLQNVGIDFGYQHKELRAGASVTLFPVADAQYDGTCALSCESAEFDARSINAFTGALVSAAGVNPQTITPGATTRPSLFVAEYRSLDTEQRPFRAVIFAARAPGFTFSMKREDFASANFTAATYLPDATRNAWRLYLGQ